MRVVSTPSALLPFPLAAPNLILLDTVEKSEVVRLRGVAWWFEETKFDEEGAYARCVAAGRVYVEVMERGEGEEGKEGKAELGGSDNSVTPASDDDDERCRASERQKSQNSQERETRTEGA